MKKFTFRAFVLSLMLIVLGACATVAPKIGKSDSRLDGWWDGTIKKTDEGPDNDLQLRLAINGDQIRVWVVHSGQWIEAKPGSFRISRYMSNAVIYAMDSGEDDDGTWVESWGLLVTLRSPDELLITWSRLVNNIDAPLDHEFSKFSVQASGVLSRTSSYKAR